MTNIKTLKQRELYLTTDLALATTISLQYPLEGIDKTTPRRAKFLFKRAAGLDRLIENYYRRDLRIDPVSFFEQLSLLKTRLYEG